MSRIRVGQLTTAWSSTGAYIHRYVPTHRHIHTRTHTHPKILKAPEPGHLTGLIRATTLKQPDRIFSAAAEGPLTGEREQGRHFQQRPVTKTSLALPHPITW